MAEQGAEPGLHSGSPVNNVSFTTSHLLQVKRGLIPGQSIVHKFGSIKYIAPFDQFKAVSASGVYKTPTVPVALELLSDDNLNDIPGGIGALEVTVYGLKTAASTEEESETIILNGATPVALAYDWWRVYIKQVTLSGTYADDTASSHASTITLREAGGGDIWALIAPESGLGFGQSEIGVFTVPANQVAYLLGHSVDVSNTNKAANVVLFSRENADDITTPFQGIMRAQVFHRNIAAGTNIERHHEAPEVKIIGPADIGFMCVGAAAMEVGVEMELLCIEQVDEV